MLSQVSVDHPAPPEEAYCEAHQAIVLKFNRNAGDLDAFLMEWLASDNQMEELLGNQALPYQPSPHPPPPLLQGFPAPGSGLEAGLAPISQPEAATTRGSDLQFRRQSSDHPRSDTLHRHSGDPQQQSGGPAGVGQSPQPEPEAGRYSLRPRSVQLPKGIFMKILKSCPRFRSLQKTTYLLES